MDEVRIKDDYWKQVAKASAAGFCLPRDAVRAASEALDTAAQGHTVRYSKPYIGCAGGSVQHPYAAQLWTTEALLSAEQALHRECSKLQNQALVLTEILCKELVAHRHQLQRAWEAVLLAQTTYEHALKAAYKGWRLVEHADEGAPLSGELWPYHQARSESTPVSVTVDGTLLLTGVNRSGKSTLLRSLALCAVAASCGLAVPGRLRMPRYASVHLRTTAKDDPMASRCGFEVEALDAVQALDSRNSLVLLDEIGHLSSHKLVVGMIIAMLELMVEWRMHAVFATHLVEAYDQAPQALRDQLRCIQLDREHRLGPGVNRDCTGIEVLRSVGAQPELLAKVTALVPPPCVVSEPAQRCQIEDYRPVLEPRPCPHHDAAALLQRRLNAVPYFVDYQELPPAALCAWHVLYIRLEPCVGYIYVGETKNIYERIQQHRANGKHSFYLFCTDNRSEAQKKETDWNKLLMNQRYVVESYREATKDF